MSDNLSKNTRIAKNTTLLYVRMTIVMIINLYTVRLVLNALGVEDYGVYNVVAGVITLLSSVTSVLATANQRYYSYSIGEKNFQKLQDIFSASIEIYFIFSVFVFLIGETLGLWFMNTQLIIPQGRMIAANWVYQFSIFSFIVSMMQIPYSAASIAHEDMSLFAFISIAECVLKLFAALLLFVVPTDKLILYGATLLIVQFFSLTAYIIASHQRYIECKYKKVKEKTIFKELLSFSGWTLFGSAASVGMNQVNTILVNIFFGPIVNAARAISFQINSAISTLANSFIMAVRPQMIKSYAEGSYSYLNKIFNISNKFIYYCLLIICLPLFFEMDTVLKLWLKTIDIQTILFCRLILIYVLIMSLNNPITIIIQATGNVKQYHVSVEFFTLLCVPVTYILFRMGYQAYYTYIVMIIAAISSHIVRLICLKKYYKSFSINEYLKSFLLTAFMNTIIVILSIYLLHNVIINPFLRLTFVTLFSLISILGLTIFVGLSKTEKQLLKQLIVKLRK